MLKGYRTIAFNLVMGILMVYQVRTGQPVPSAEAVQTGIDDVGTGLAVLWVAGSAVLRAITNTRIGRKD